MSQRDVAKIVFRSRDAGAKEFLRAVAERLCNGKSQRETVRDLLSLFGYARRGTEVIKHVRAALRKHGLTTEPDFATADFDSKVTFVLRSAAVPRDTPTTPKVKESRFGNISIKPYNKAFPEATPESGYRLLTDSHPLYMSLLERLRSENRVFVYNHGQNSFREDRDEFPFYIAIDRRHLGKQIGEEHDRYVRDLAREFGEPDEVPTAEPEPTEDIELFGAPEINIELDAFESRISERLEKGLGSVRDEIFAATAEMEKSIIDQVNRLQHDTVRKLAALQNETELQKLIDEEDAKNKSKLQEKDEYAELLTEEISSLAAQNEELRAALQERDENSVPGDAYPTLERTVELFADLAVGEPIFVNDSALRSAAESSCTKRRDVMRLLLTLRELANQLYRLGNESKIGPLREWFESLGYDLALQDAEVTTTKYGHLRTFNVEGRQVLFKEHVTLFPNNNRDCVQVYFERDSENRRIVIGYVGNHLRTTSRPN